MLELMAVVLVVAILATLAMPSITSGIVIEQVTKAITLSALAKQAIATQYAQTTKLPADNAAANLPPADHIVSNLVSEVSVVQGTITITFGNQANLQLRGKLLSLRPAVVPGYPQVPITWICAGAAVPKQMQVSGVDKTNLSIGQLPFACRP